MVHRNLISVGILCLFIVSTFFIGISYMSDLAIKSRCHQIDASEWNEIVTSYERAPITRPEAPFRNLEFFLEFPIHLKPDDILLFKAYSVSRNMVHYIYDGPPPRNGHIKARLAVDGEETIEVYWLEIELIRPSTYMTCGWSLEERFELPATPHPMHWRLELLAEPILTDDGGSRVTRLSPLGDSQVPQRLPKS